MDDDFEDRHAQVKQFYADLGMFLDRSIQEYSLSHGELFAALSFEAASTMREWQDLCKDDEDDGEAWKG